MKIKNKASVLIIIIFIALAFVLHTGCSRGENVTEDIVSATTEEVQMTDETMGTTLPEITHETEPLKDLYVSSSQDFENYSFIVPENWKLLATDSGERVVLSNDDDRTGIESIFIFVEDISADETINSSEDVLDLYKNPAAEEDEMEFFEEEEITIDGFDSKITGCNYRSGLDDGSGGETVYTDYFTFIEKDDFIYSIKMISSGQDRKSSLETFKDFMDSFSLDNQDSMTAKEDESSSVNILILGDDSGMDRPGGRVNGRTDIIILLHLNIDECKGTAVTIPRDTWIDIPGQGEGKINGAHAIGGNELTVKAVEQLSGLKIDNYIITDFDGFIPLIDFLGGVTIEVGEDLSDGFSGCFLTKGVHHLDGQQALALSRNRHRNGDGTTQSGAFAREKEAAKIIIALLDQKSTFERIVAMPLFINYLLRYTWTDLKVSDVIRLLPVLGKISANDIEITTIPSWPQSFGNASAVAYDEEETAELFEEIKNQ